jgi:hypothetical protein
MTELDEGSLLRHTLSTMLSPCNMKLFDTMQKTKEKELEQKRDKCNVLGHVKPIPSSTDKRTLRAHFYTKHAPNKKISHALIKKNFAAFAANHVIPLHLLDGVFVIGVYGMAVGGGAGGDGDDGVITSSMVHLVARDDLNLIHDPTLDMKQLYKINDASEIPTYEPVPGVTLPRCDMRFVVMHAKKEAKKKIKKETEAATAVPDGSGLTPAPTLNSSNHTPAQRQRKTASELAAIMNQCHAMQTTSHTFCMADEFTDDPNRLPVLILSSDMASVTEVQRLLGHQYVPLTRSEHDRNAFFPPDHVIDHEMIARLLQQLIDTETTPLSNSMDTLPLLQAMYLCAGRGIDQAFWNYLSRKILTSDTVDEFARVADTDTQASHEALQIRASMENGRKIFEQLKKMKSSLLATMAPLIATIRLITNIGSAKEIKYERGVGHQKQPVCIATKRGIVPGQPHYFFQCHLNSIVSGGVAGQGTLMFFMSSAILTSVTKMKDAVTFKKTHYVIPDEPMPDAADPYPNQEKEVLHDVDGCIIFILIIHFSLSLVCRDPSHGYRRRRWTTDHGCSRSSSASRDCC